LKSLSVATFPANDPERAPSAILLVIGVMNLRAMAVVAAAINQNKARWEVRSEAVPAPMVRDRGCGVPRQNYRHCRLTCTQERGGNLW
jgi:hypothetical protein